MRRFIWGIFALIIIVALGLWPTSRGVWQITIGQSAAWCGRKASGINGGLLTLMRLSKLDNKLKDLETKNTELKAEVVGLARLKKENEVLRKELGLLDKHSVGSSTPARVIGRGPTNFLQTFVLDRGSNDNVIIGQTVTAQGYLVGTIKLVTPYTSTVKIIAGGQLLLPVALQESGGTGLMRGGLEGLIIDEIPLDVTVKKGEPVITQDLEGVVMPGVVVGTVQSVIQHKGDIFQRVIAESPLDFSRLEIVMINKQQ